MSEPSTPSRPPVAVRIARPYESDDELLSNESETIGKTSVILIGAAARPVGVILRFEMTLADGTVALRGEGRVLGHKEHAFRGQPGLALRFTRLDPKSKALVDRATAMREARATGGAIDVLSQPSMEVAASLPPPSSRASMPVAAPASVRPPSVRPTLIASVAPPSERPPTTDDAPAHEPAQEPAPAHTPEPAHAHAPESAPEPAPAQVAGPAGRDAMLARLRERSAALSPERVAEILASRPPR